jgi:hypothetical protein
MVGDEEEEGDLVWWRRRWHKLVSDVNAGTVQEAVPLQSCVVNVLIVSDDASVNVSVCVSS